MRNLFVMLLAVAATLFAVPANAVPAHAAPVTKRLAVVVIQNGDTTGEQTHLADTAYLRNVFFGGSNSLASWMSAVSQGQLAITPAGDGVFTTPPSDELRDADKAGCHTNLATKIAENHLKGLGVSWDSLAIVFDIAGCGWGGLGQVPGRLTWYPPRPGLAAIVHEIGHNQGYPHESKRDCPGGDIAACKANGYSGNTPMGSGGSGRGYSSTELLHSGWIESSAKVVASAPGTFTLKPLYASGAGARVVEYKAGGTRSYVIETRAPSSGVDSAITNPGVRIYSVTSGDYRNAFMINPGSGYVPAGSSLTDTANKLRITVKSSSATGATVVVASLAATAGSRPSTSPSPSVSPATIEPSAEASSDPVPDKESDLLDTSAIPPKDDSIPPTLVLGVAGFLFIVILLGTGGYLLRASRRRARHRQSWG